MNSYGLINIWTSDYANFSAGKISIVEEGSNTYARLYPNSVLTKACNTAILAGGTYTLSFSAKLSNDDEKGRLLFNFFAGSWLLGENKVDLDISSVNSEDWVTITHEFSIDTTLVSDFVNLDLEYLASSNSIMLDNIKIIDSTDTDLENAKNGDFENFSAVDALDNVGWYANENNDVIYVNPISLENSLILENGNKVFKAYTSSGVSCDIDFAGNVMIAEAGTYIMSIKVKLGAGATNVDNIGFRFFSNANLGTGEYVFEGLDQLNSDEWVTLNAYFTVDSVETADFININFWFFTHNDEIQSIDNYVLIDDVAVNRVNIG